MVRAWVQHRPPLPWKAWYATPAFRYERPQAGRYRQHHQLGVEALGPADPDLDVEVVALADGFFRSLGLAAFALRLNSMGDDTCRPAYLDLLTAYLAERRDRAVRRAPGPPGGQPAAGPRLQARRLPGGHRRDAPGFADHLCDACAAHFARVRAGPRRPGRRPTSSTTAWCAASTTTPAPPSSSPPTALESAQNGIGGGGRYDGLVEMLGGPPTPGIGFGMGIERILLACDAEGVFAGRPRPARRLRGRHRRRDGAPAT